jgi:hypothetical protein
MPIAQNVDFMVMVSLPDNIPLWGDIRKMYGYPAGLGCYAGIFNVI